MDITYKDENFYELLRCGVPRAVLQNCEFELDGYVDQIKFKSNNVVKHIPSSKQVDVFEKTLKEKGTFKKNWLYVISGNTDPAKARCCGAMIIDRYLTRMNKQVNDDTLDDSKRLTRKPLWHSLYTGFTDKLRDDRNYKERVGIPGLLVLDCVYVDMGRNKYDKVRELIDMYCDIPRVIIGAGSDPITICRENIFCVPNRVLFLADSFDVVQF